MAYLVIGNSPEYEGCVQIEPGKDYLPAMRAECVRFLEAIRKKVGPEPAGARLAIISREHEFGTYLTVACIYNDGEAVPEAYALLCESEPPVTWNDIGAIGGLLDVSDFGTLFE